MISTETHFYDGKLSSRKTEIDKLLTKASSYKKEEKLKAFSKLLEYLRTKPCFTSQTEINLSTIIRDYAQDNAYPNYDQTNNLFAIDLLWLCYELCFLGTGTTPEEVSILLNVQLDEMSSGMCAQGRVARLFQVVSSFSEFL